MSAIPAPGDVIAGKFRVERVIGEGGMACVLAATHLELHERVAIKVILPELATSAEVVSRFLREARAAVKIKGEHVVRVMDVGRLESGAPYMVMEYLEGIDLHDLFQRGPLPVETACDYLLQACEAVASAHALGIVHRDLKPSNLFLTTSEDGSPCVKVLDFGISKISGPADPSAPKTRDALGTPLYMSPEQMTSASTVDARADVWALGVTLHELVAGTTPFAEESMPQLCALILQGAPTRLRDVVPDAPVGLEAIVLRCLEKDPARRYADVAELAEALAEHAPDGARAEAQRVRAVLSRKRAAATPTGERAPPASDPGAAAPPRAGPKRDEQLGETLPAEPVTPAVVPQASAAARTQTQWGTPAEAPLAPKRGVLARLPFRGAPLIGAVAAVVLLVAASVFVITRPSGELPPEPASAAPPAVPEPQAPTPIAPSSAAAPEPRADHETPIEVTAATATPPPTASSRAARPPASKPSSHPSSTPASTSPPAASPVDPFSKRNW